MMSICSLLLLFTWNLLIFAKPIWFRKEFRWLFGKVWFAFHRTFCTRKTWEAARILTQSSWYVMLFLRLPHRCNRFGSSLQIFILTFSQILIFRFCTTIHILWFIEFQAWCFSLNIENIESFMFKIHRKRFWKYFCSRQFP